MATPTGTAPAVGKQAGRKKAGVKKADKRGPASAETRAKIAAAMKERHQQRKEQQG